MNRAAFSHGNTQGCMPEYIHMYTVSSLLALQTTLRFPACVKIEFQTAELSWLKSLLMTRERERERKLPSKCNRESVTTFNSLWFARSLTLISPLDSGIRRETRMPPFLPSHVLHAVWRGWRIKTIDPWGVAQNIVVASLSRTRDDETLFGHGSRVIPLNKVSDVFGYRTIEGFVGKVV